MREHLIFCGNDAYAEVLCKETRAFRPAVRLLPKLGIEVRLFAPINARVLVQRRDALPDGISRQLGEAAKPQLGHHVLSMRTHGLCAQT